MPHTAIRPAKFWLVSAVILLVANISGCANLKAIKEFAALSSESATYEGLTKDYVATIERRKQYEPAKFHDALDKRKAIREAQLEDLQALQQVVSAYMKGLGDLASDEVIDFDKSIEGLAGGLNKSKLLDEKDKNAFTVVSALLARAATDAYRQRELNKLINDSNQPFQDVIAATRKIVRQGMVADLQVESDLVGRYYDDFMFAPKNPSEPVAMVLASQAKVEALGQVDKRIQTVNSYVSVLEKIAAGHQYLYDNREKITKDEVARQLKPYIDKLRSAYKALRNANQ